MNQSEVRLLQVSVTGTRLKPCSDEELLRRLMTKFKLTETQGALMLKGRCVVKRGVDAASARKFVVALSELGLQAVVEEISPPGHAAPPITQRAESTQPRAAPLDALRALADQRLSKPRPSFPYLLGLLLVTFLSVALPAIYIGLTGGIAFGWLWYLTHIHEHLPRSAHMVALMYAGPGLVGAVLLLFLIRPLFAPSPQARKTLSLDPEQEAGFVSGVHALCRAIGVSPPVEIRLSWDANASVQFRGGWLGLLTGHKVLTIGLSLVGGLSARQFVGVLAHEFGHFAQRMGMICSFTVNSVNAWFEHRAYGEDTWDRKFREWSEDAVEKEHWFAWIVQLSIGASWIAIRATRLLMAGLFHISLRLSSYMSRQMAVYGGAAPTLRGNIGACAQPQPAA